jgi:hypothetical protein
VKEDTFAVTFDDIRKIALGWPEVEDGTSYGTPALASPITTRIARWS